MKAILWSTVISTAVCILAGAALLADAQDGAAPGQAKPKYQGLSDEEAAQLERRIETTVRAAGVLESANVRSIKCDVPDGAKILWVVEDGATVKKGDKLLQFDEAPLREKVLQQEIVLRSAEVAAAQAKDDLAVAEAQREESLQASKADLDAARLSLDEYFGPGGEYELRLVEVEGEMVIAQGRLKVAEKLIKELEAAAGAVAKREQDAARQAALEARTALDIAQAKRKLLTERTRARRKAALEAAVAASEAALLRVKVKAAAGVEAAQAELQARQQAKKLESDKLTRLQQSLAACVVHAPLDGMVVYGGERSRWGSQRLVVEEGAAVARGQEVLRMPDLSKLQVRVLVNETRIDRVKLGHPAVIRFNHSPHRALRGEVQFIANQAEQRTFVAAAVSEYAVVVSLEAAGEDLKPGMTCMAEIDVSGTGTSPAVPKGPKSSKTSARDFFKVLDKNGDGKLSRDEVPEALKAAFDSLDKNSDGFVDQAELEDARKRFRSKSAPKP
jgi:HlyD family secretion protein